MAEEKQVDFNEALNNVQIMAERVASLYYHMVTTLEEEFGAEKTEELVEKIIGAYGKETGENTRKRVAELGFEPDIENYKLGQDLPSFGWKKKVVIPEKERGTIGMVDYCPFADYWKKRGFERWGRLYCHVDQAKYHHFNPDITCTHDKNQLDGDEQCWVHAVQK